MRRPTTRSPSGGGVRQLRLLWRCSERAVCKLSGMVTEADWYQWSVEDLRPYADTVLDAFGPRQLLFGSDLPVCRLAATYAEVAAAQELTSALHPAEHREVFAGTALRIYRLTVTGPTGRSVSTMRILPPTAARRSPAEADRCLVVTCATSGH
ncbi:amidohydrolase family protein [Streptomyces luteogriseus]|uniref:amidohydrolase family protein n=1 Tax=Streptomyces luteogriseus TaxID=68233 RepID=UPI003805129F